MTENHPPRLADVLAIPQPVALGPGLQNKAAGDEMRPLTAEALFAPMPIRDADMARACLAGLWLKYDFLDEAHTICQSIDTPEGSFWHAIVHRREGDFGNSNYWWRRVGNHPALIGDPFAFVHEVQRLVTEGRGDAMTLERRQDREWQALFDFCMGRAIDISR
jgi:hypothetical protein